MGGTGINRDNKNGLTRQLFERVDGSETRIFDTFVGPQIVEINRRSLELISRGNSCPHSFAMGFE